MASGFYLDLVISPEIDDVDVIVIKFLTHQLSLGKIWEHIRLIEIPPVPYDKPNVFLYSLLLNYHNKLTDWLTDCDPQQQHERW